MRKTSYPCSRCGKRPHEYGSSICRRCSTALRWRQRATDLGVAVRRRVARFCLRYPWAMEARHSWRMWRGVK